VYSLNQPIAINDAIAAFPTLARETAHPSRSESYAHISTLDVIRAVTNNGPALHGVTVAKVRKADRLGFEKHLLRFRVPSFTWAEESPELVIVNSHDGTSALQAFAGIIRFACANGLIVGTAFEKVRVTHTSLKAPTVIDATYRVLDTFESLGKRVATFKSVALTPAEQADMASKAVALRYPENNAIPFAPAIDPTLALVTRRHDDSPASLWHTLNRIQESVMGGGLRGRRTNLATGRNRNFTLRAVKGIGATVDLNRALFDLADSVAASHGATL